MRQELRKILARVFVALLMFLIGVVIYKQGNPYAYPGLENRILFVLVPSGIVLLYLYLEERESSPSLVHVCVSKVLAVIHPYLHKMSGYMLKQDPKQVVSHAFLGMLLIVALQSIFPQPSLGWARTPVIIAAVVLGVVTFYLNRDKLGEIEEEARKEEIEEKRREMEFGEKYPLVNRVWGVRWVVRWTYKEGWWYSGILLLIVLWGGFLIFHNLGSVDFYHDESWHVSVIESLRHGEGFNTWNFIENKSDGPYTRGYLTNWFGYQFSMLFGYNEFTLRLFVAIVGIMNIPLVYIIFKTFIGKNPALLTTIGFTFNIIVLYLARFLRPYPVFLFFYILSFYFTYKLVQKIFEKSSFRMVIVNSFLLVLCVTLSVQASQFGKLLFLIIPLYLLSYFIIKGKIGFNFNIINMNGKILSASLIALSILFLLIDYFKVINLNILPDQISTFISFNRMQNTTDIYYLYIFEKYIKSPPLMYILYGIGCFYLLIEGILKKKDKLISFLIFATVPLFTMIYLFNRYEDFRYIYFLIPFVYGTAMYGLFKSIQYVFFLKKRINPLKILTISIVIILLFLFYPVLPIDDIHGFSLKSPSIWQGADGSNYLHRRAVAPEYSKVYNYLDGIQKAGDIVIMVDGLHYIKSKNEVEYYSLSAFDYNKTLINLRTKQEIDFFELIEKSKDKKVYLVGAYMHMLDPELNECLINNCHNLAKDLGIKKYDYNGFYKGRYYWPNLFVCNSSSSD